MDKFVIASTRKNAGKTSIIIGLTEVLQKKCGYLKPIGDRLLYRKKRLWDYDSELLTHTLGINEKPEDISIGFEHAKLRYMYDEAGIREKLREQAALVAADKDVLFIEAGSGLNFASSIHLDALSLARHLDAKLILVVGGDEDEILDDITFVKKHLACDEVQIAGVIINRVKDVDDFTATYMAEIEALGVKVLGVLPYKQELTYMPVRYLVDHLFAKVIGGEGGLHKIVQSVFVGAMSVSAAVQNPLFKKENKMIITSGDRSDMILVALETDTSCVVLTNNTLPPANIVAKADAANVPMLLVPWDTYRTAQQIDLMDPLLTKDDKPKLELLKKLVGESVKTQALFD